MNSSPKKKNVNTHSESEWETEREVFLFCQSISPFVLWTNVVCFDFILFFSTTSDSSPELFRRCQQNADNSNVTF